MTVLKLDDILNSSSYIPLEPQVKELIEFSKNDAFLRSIVNSFKNNDDLIAKGVANMDHLKSEFNSVHQEALVAGYGPSDSTGIFGAMYNKILHKVLIQESGFIEGKSINSTLARAKYYLNSNNIQSALLEVESIDGPASDVLSAWKDSAKNRLFALQLSTTLKSHIFLNNQQ